ncbi:hypothetical protein PDUR_19925 [Paenibacillus durus]|uniref:Uncharacterized protein n=1 Tax=Paenibacillus durus TaxID=44251 RepID=A0A089HS96_PAEDU|nr:hypothetical protein PDUR_19925 [Paenibacillus durus]
MKSLFSWIAYERKPKWKYKRVSNRFYELYERHRNGVSSFYPHSLAGGTAGYEDGYFKMLLGGLAL